MKKVIILALSLTVLGSSAYSEEIATENAPKNLWSKEKASYKAAPIELIRPLARLRV